MVQKEKKRKRKIFIVQNIYIIFLQFILIIYIQCFEWSPVKEGIHLAELVVFKFNLEYYIVYLYRFTAETICMLCSFISLMI